MTILPQLHVHTNGHALMTEDGAPFFWLGDTAWELFHRLSREEARRYFETRQRQRFNVVQAVALAEFNGLSEPNRYGELPLFDRDPTRPNDAYFRLVDEYIDMAAAHEIYIGLLPTWGDKVAKGMWMSENVIFTPENARIYGRRLGERYRDRSNIIWIMGGDRPAVYDTYDERPVWRALAEGIREHIPHALMSYHTKGGESSSRDLHEEPWLDVNMMQSGHGGGHDVPVWDWITDDYARTPTKPTLDGEPNYEDHPVNPWPTWDPANGYFRDYDVRKQTYRSVFAGGCGVTYGHHAVWQFYAPEREVVNYADRYWTEAITRPGAEQMRRLRALIESRPLFTRIPDQSLLRSDAGAGPAHIRATRDSNGQYALIYFPQPMQTAEIDLTRLAGETARAWWYDPRSGSAQEIGVFPTTQPHAFTTPADGPDWVLALDSVDAGFAPPGQA
jgi:hypothetical protein